MADIEARVSTAIVTILEADAGVQTLTGRTSGNIIPEQDVATFPGGAILMYELVSLDEIGGAGENYLATYRLTAIAEGNGARSTTASLLERVKYGLSQPALSAQGLDAFPQAPWRRHRLPLQPDASRALAGATVEATFLVTK